MGTSEEEEIPTQKKFFLYLEYTFQFLVRYLPYHSRLLQVHIPRHFQGTQDGSLKKVLPGHREAGNGTILTDSANKSHHTFLPPSSHPCHRRYRARLDQPTSPSPYKPLQNIYPRRSPPSSPLPSPSFPPRRRSLRRPNLTNQLPRMEFRTQYSGSCSDWRQPNPSRTPSCETQHSG